MALDRTVSQLKSRDLVAQAAVGLKFADYVVNSADRGAVVLTARGEPLLGTAQYDTYVVLLRCSPHSVNVE